MRIVVPNSAINRRAFQLTHTVHLDRVHLRGGGELSVEEPDGPHAGVELRYQDAFDCRPPPIFILLITILQCAVLALNCQSNVIYSKVVYTQKTQLQLQRCR